MSAPQPLLITNARVLTMAVEPAGSEPSSTRNPHALSPIQGCDVLVQEGQIAAVGPGLAAPANSTRLDANGRVLMPGFIDCHTHACYAGSRLDEWEQKLAGVSYLELLNRGGGIMATVRATRQATQTQLADALLARLHRALRHGTTTIEVKSGYGLSTQHELTMLRAIHDAAAQWPGTVIPTACLAHAIDPDFPGGHDAFVDHTINETLPAVAAEFPGITVDGYCETGAWSLEQSLRFIKAAADLGLPARFHADQFNDLGFIPAATQLGIRSVDHLEASAPEHLAQLAASNTFGVALPAAGFHLDDRYADCRVFLDAGGKLALATNHNPGSAPCLAIPEVIALAVRKCGLSPAQAIAATTTAPAALLNLPDRGTIAPGKRADLILVDHHDERHLAFEFGGNPVRAVIVKGSLTHTTDPLSS